jgi:putative oxidoreductase
MSRYGITILRLALGIVYVWFGALKLVGKSPTADLVAETTPILPARVSVPLVGAMEVAIGVGLITRLALPLTLTLFFGQVFSTFLVLLELPSKSYQNGNPLLLTDRGEKVVKNLVLLAAGIVIASTQDRPTEMLPQGSRRFSPEE